MGLLQSLILLMILSTLVWIGFQVNKLKGE